MLVESLDSDPSLSSGKSGQVHIGSDNKETLPDEQAEKQADTSNQAAALTGNVEERVVLSQNESQFLSSNKCQSKETLPRERQRPQTDASNQGAVIGDSIVDDGQVPNPSLSSSKSGRVHFRSEGKQSLAGEHQHPLATTANQKDAMSVNVGGTIAAEQSHVPDNPTSSSKSSHGRVTSENKQNISGDHQLPQVQKNNQIYALTENVDAGMVVDQSDVQFLSAKGFGQVLLKAEMKNVLASKGQELRSETSNQAAVVKETVDEGRVVDPSQDSETTYSSGKSDQDSVSFKHQETLASDCQQPQAETGNHATMTGSVCEGMVVDHSEDPEERLLSRKSGHLLLKIEILGSSSSEYQQVLAESTRQALENAEDNVVKDRSRGQVLFSSKSVPGDLAKFSPGKHEELQTKKSRTKQQKVTMEEFLKLKAKI